MSSVMVARTNSSSNFDPAFRLLDNSFSRLELSGLGAKQEMYSGGASSGGDGGYGGGYSQQPQPGHQQRPQLGRRVTSSSSSSSNLYQRQPTLTELGGSASRQYYSSPESARAYPMANQGWLNPGSRDSLALASARLSSTGGGGSGGSGVGNGSMGSSAIATANSAAAAQRYSQDYYGSSITSNPYIPNPPPGLTPPEIQQQPVRQQTSLQSLPQLSPSHLMTPDGGQLLASSPHRRSSGRDEFDGPHQLLAKPADSHIEVPESALIQLPISLYAQEQDSILSEVNDRLSQCAYDFVAKYQFPIPLEPDKRPVRLPADREWTEWCYLLKRLATKRRIPARVLYNGQIKQLVTVLENSLEMRHAAKHQSRPLKDDRNVLQLISAGLQVAKMLKDPEAMRYLDDLYSKSEALIESRKREQRRGAASRE
ncbi:hypothetical protein AAFC00_003857 [Neodothiora populina]|uniref:Uncharacterized protein n=1 Tax=Neodothiora populina TaxID=2781224 RepID=A0ABR3PFM6_9PEZI